MIEVTQRNVNAPFRLPSGGPNSRRWIGTKGPPAGLGHNRAL
jgi:hypothetical protein